MRKMIEKIMQIIKSLHWVKLLGIIPIPHHPNWNGKDEWHVSPSLGDKVCWQKCGHSGCYKVNTVEHWENLHSGWKVNNYRDRK
jgi:hypothetical protein